MMDFFKTWFRRETSSTTAKERLRLVLLSDHLSLAPDVVENLRRDLIAVISRYVEVDEAHCDVTFEQQDSSVAMLANIPILKMKEPPRGGTPAPTAPAPVPPPSTPPFSRQGAHAEAAVEAAPTEAVPSVEPTLAPLAEHRTEAPAERMQSGEAQAAHAPQAVAPKRRRRRRRPAASLAAPVQQGLASPAVG
jgi:cell division topological specificity factor